MHLHFNFSKLISSHVPGTLFRAEANTVSYSYAASGNPCNGAPSAPCSRTDARNISTTYAYDTVNRLTSKTYSDGTPTAQYYYDSASVWGENTTNAKGRLVLAQTAGGADIAFYVCAPQWAARTCRGCESAAFGVE